jgi:ubiquinone/menaquinone biosynthesis C-methylase UbiE
MSDRFGINWEEVDSLSLEFIRLVKGGLVADLGCGSGNFALQLLSKGCSVVANDISENFLNELKSRANSNSGSKLRILKAQFPNTTKFNNESLDGVYSARMIQFLHPPEVKEGFEKIYSWLKSGGYLCIVAFTPFRKFLSGFEPIFQKRLTEKNSWPGEITDYHKYLDDEWKALLPNYVNLFDENILLRELKRVGFSVLDSKYLPSTDDEPINQRGLIAALARK